MDRSCWMLVLAGLWTAGCSAGVLAAPPAAFDVYLDERAPLTAAQEWSAKLAQVGLQVQIRGKRPGDAIEVQQAGNDARYRVTGAINSSGELVLPGARFRLGDAAQIKAWFNDLGRLGPPGQRPARLAFGMLPEKVERLRADLSQPVGFATAGMSAATVVGQIRTKVRVPIEVGNEALAAIQQEKVAEELDVMACGTALACVLRPAGLCLVPREGSVPGKPLQVYCEVVASRPGLEIWPVGWPPDKPDRDLLPGLYEFRNVNLENVPITRVLKAIGGQLKLPVLWDHNAMARHGVEPEKALVTLPKSRTTYSLTLRKALFQARLKHEIRVDEAETPFFWITTVKPL